MPDYNLLSSLSNALPTLTEAYASICSYVLEHRLEVKAAWATLRARGPMVW